jgi:low temperature requirement protein LtrA
MNKVHQIKQLKRNLLPMIGRPINGHRSESRLELFFDLTMVTAFWVASSQLSEYVVKGYWMTGAAGFTFAMLALIVAWMSCTSFASAFDNGDWLFRVTTMLQMVGIIVIAIGIPSMFESIKEDGQVNNLIMVAGYVIMRIPLIFQWLRVAKYDKRYRKKAKLYAKSIGLAQALWVAMIILQPPVVLFILISFFILGLELGVPWLIERHGSIPWHPHHLAERFGSLAIIAIGECIFGTVAALSAIIEDSGMSPEVVLVGLAGVGIAFSMWWLYFALPSGDILAYDRSKSLSWSYAHFAIFVAITAAGAGIHNIAYFLEHHSVLTSFETLLSLIIPLLIFSLAVSWLYMYSFNVSTLRHYLRYQYSLLIFYATIASIAVANYNGLGILPSLMLLFGVMVIVVINDEINVKPRREERLQKVLNQ